MPPAAEGSEKASSLDRPDVPRRSINHRLRDSPPPRSRRSPSSSPEGRREHHSRRRSRSPRRHGHRNDRRDDQRYRDYPPRDYRQDRAYGNKEGRADYNGDRRFPDHKRRDSFEHEHGGRDKKRRYDQAPSFTAATSSNGSNLNNNIDQAHSKARHDNFDRVMKSSAPGQENVRHGIRSKDFAHTTGNAPPAANGDRNDTANTGPTQGEIEESKPEEPAPPVLSIEERRKRREAIRAKYQSMDSVPSAVDGLKLENALDTPSPMESSEALTPNITGKSATQSPRDSPHAIVEAGSPEDFTLTKTADIDTNDVKMETNQSVEEPTAADYDPSADMEADRVRQELKLQGQNSGSNPEQLGLKVEAGGKLELDDPKSAAAPQAKRKRDKEDLFDFDGEDDDESDDEPLAQANPDNVKGRYLENTALDIWDDHQGYYKLHIGEIVNKQWKILSKLGQGTFSGVFDASNINNGARAAIKIMRKGEAFYKAGQREVKYLQLLKQHDPDDKRHAIRYWDSFSHREHFCIVFESLKQDLRTTLKRNGMHNGLHISAVRYYARQIFQALWLFRKCEILHADLKPDNILVDDTDKMIKVCDMGSAEEHPQHEIKTYMASRFYRAPEIILGMPIDYAIDIWAVGCTLFELYTGKILFSGESNNQMLKVMMDCRGKIPNKMLKRSEYAYDYFEGPNFAVFVSQEKDKFSGRIVGRKLPMNKIDRTLRDRVMEVARAEKGGDGLLDPTEAKEMDAFVDFLDKTLQLNPEKRLTPTEALQHPFIMRTAPAKAVPKIKPSFKSLASRK